VPKILICYLVHLSGHHSAALAIERALTRLDPHIETLVVDLLAYTHPQWAAIIQNTYLGTIRRTPDVWNALYDSPAIELRTRAMRRLIQRGRSRSFVNLMESFRPDAAVCTQAHPLAVLSAFAQRQRPDLPLWGVLTDFVPHRFWVTESHDVKYVVPLQSAADRLVWLGVDRARIHMLGIPVWPELQPQRYLSFRGRYERRVLVMGGGRGLGVRYRTLRELDRSPQPFTIDVVTGINRSLRGQLARKRHRFRHPIRVRGHVENTMALMHRAELLISKPGGVTSAEAMAVGLPMVLVRPLPGQEQGNTDVLVRHGAAVHIQRERDLAPVVTSLLAKPALLAMMRERALALGRPGAALDMARLIRTSLQEIPGREAEELVS